MHKKHDQSCAHKSFVVDADATVAAQTVDQSHLHMQQVLNVLNVQNYDQQNCVHNARQYSKNDHKLVQLMVQYQRIQKENGEQKDEIAKDAEIVRCNQTACRSSLWKQNLAESERSISRPATRISPASRAFARAS